MGHLVTILHDAIATMPREDGLARLDNCGLKILVLVLLALVLPDRFPAL